MNPVLQEIGLVLPVVLAQEIIGYSHLPLRLSLLHSILFSREFPTKLDAPIKEMNLSMEGGIPNICFFYQATPGSKCFKYPRKTKGKHVVGTRHLGDQDVNEFSNEFGFRTDIKTHENRFFKLQNRNLIIRTSLPNKSSRISVQSVHVHNLSLGSFCIFDNRIYVLDTWLGHILTYVVTNNDELSLQASTNISASISQSRYFHSIQVTDTVIAVSRKDTMFLFDRFGTELVMIDIPDKDPGFFLFECCLYVIVRNELRVYQLV